MHRPSEQRAHRRLDLLARWVAARIEEGADAAAWTVTLAVEALAGEVPDAGHVPPAPVIGRRFARAHRLLLENGVGHRPVDAGIRRVVALALGPIDTERSTSASASRPPPARTCDGLPAQLGSSPARTRASRRASGSARSRR